MNNSPEREADIFNATLKLPVGRRAAFLDMACAGEAALRRQIEELLRASEEAGDFLERPAARRARNDLAE